MKPRKVQYLASLHFLVFLTFSALIALVSSSNAATYNVYGGIKASWPSSWTPVPSLGDPDDSQTERLDFVGATTPGGDAANYAFYKYADSTYAYFRVRVDTGTYGGIKNLDPGGEWTDNIWIMIDGDADGDPDYALAWDSNTWDAGGTEPHGLEFQVLDKVSSVWNNTTFNDIDQNAAKKLWVSGSNPGECNGLCTGCWHVDIPYTGGTGYVRIVDDQATTTWGTTMFIDIAVTWAYLASASTSAHACNTAFPVLSPSGTWKLQMGSLANANDHGKVSTDVGANTNPSDAMAWSNDVPTLVDLVAFTATASLERVTLYWETATEIDTAGFHIWRSESTEGMYDQITATLIPAKGGVSQGATYAYEDTAVQAGRAYYYKLEEVNTQGNSTFHGPVSVITRSKDPGAVPALSGWGLLIAMAALGAAGAGALLRRRKGI